MKNLPKLNQEVYYVSNDGVKTIVVVNHVGKKFAYFNLNGKYKIKLTDFFMFNNFGACVTDRLSYQDQKGTVYYSKSHYKEVMNANNLYNNLKDIFWSYKRPSNLNLKKLQKIQEIINENNAI